MFFYIASLFLIVITLITHAVGLANGSGSVLTLVILLGFGVLFSVLIYGNRYRKKTDSTLQNFSNTPLLDEAVTVTGNTTEIEIAGESYYQEALVNIFGAYHQESQEIECEAKLVRDSRNSHDKNAIKCFINNLHVGFVNREDAEEIAYSMDKRNLSIFKVSATVRGGWKRGKGDQGMYGVVVNVPDEWI